MFTVLFTIFAAGCVLPDPDPGQSGEEMIGCLPASTQDYPLADSTPLGFTGQQVVDLVSGAHPALLSWDKGGSTDLAVDVTVSATSVTWRDMEWQDDGSGAENATMEAGGCDDDLQLAVALGFSTADGAFAETWDLDVTATTVDSAGAYLELDLDAIAGTYTVTEVDPADFDDVRAFLTLTLDADGAAGTLDGQGEKVDGETASATGFAIATFE